MENLEDYVKQNKYMVVAHRGASGTAMENSISAFTEAVRMGAIMVETDIQFTKDHQIVAFHDFFPAGLDKKISDLTYKEISELKLSKYIKSNDDDARIPLLSEVIDSIRDKCYLMIEIKTLSIEQFNENVTNLLGLIKEYNYEQKCLFGSFNYKALAIIRSLNPNIPLAAIKIPTDKSLPSLILKSLNYQVYICSIEELSLEIVDDASKNNIFVAVYGVDNKKQFDKAIKFGVRAIGTNYPDIISNYLSNEL